MNGFHILQKAFDTVDIWAMVSIMRNVRVDLIYIELLTYIYKNATMNIKLYETTKKYIQRAVRQGDTIIHSGAGGHIKKLYREDRGVMTQGENLTDLWFADDVVIFAKEENGLTKMLQELKTEAT